MGIFSDMIEIILEIFMDDFSVFGDSYKGCLENLRKVLERCQEKNLVLNWEKCHFMVTQGIVLGHIDRTRPGYPSKFPGWSRLVESHCTISKECTKEPHLKKRSIYLQHYNTLNI